MIILPEITFPYSFVLRNYPETGYGYIKFNPHKYHNRAFAVDRFVEKPSLEVAKEYLETEEYLWNNIDCS